MRKPQLKIIYDLGANNGDDLEYYLKKADIVVAVEANPVLCDLVRKRFAREIDQGKLFVENYALSATVGDRPYATFYVHKTNHVLSQFPAPSAETIDKFTPIEVPVATPKDLISKHGAPFYIKIDLENYDGEILRHLFSNEIRPPFISAEAHSVEVFCILVALGGYDAFKLVDGRSVSNEYAHHSFIDIDGRAENFSFPFHSAGPFGDDVKGEWMNANNFLRKIALDGVGWKDIHATNARQALESVHVRQREFLFQSAEILSAWWRSKASPWSGRK